MTLIYYNATMHLQSYQIFGAIVGN